MEPSYQARRVSFAFTAIVVVALGSFLAVGAAAPATFSRSFVGAIPASIVFAAALIVGAVVLTGIYVVIANRRAP